MMGVQRLIGVFVCACLLVASPAAAEHVDAVMYWNGIARQTAVRPGVDGPSGVIDLAIVHIAMHDAIQSIQGRFHTYAALGPSQGSEVAAVAAAAHAVLVNRFSSAAQVATLDATLSAFLAHNFATCDDNCQSGLAAGVSAANAVMNLRLNDGAFPGPTSFTGGTAPGEWRPTASGPMTQAWLGAVSPFTLTDSAQFQPEPPPALTSREYAKDYNEVKSLGQNTSIRTPEQNAKALFFREGPPPLWGRTLAVLVPAHVPEMGNKARLLALVYMAMADAVITAWQSKVHFNFWRPETAIQLGDSDNNPRTAGVPGWLPHTGTPPYPDYTSGANNLTGAVTGILDHFFETDEMTFQLLGASSSRTYHRFSDVADDVCEARVLQGIHFRFADTVARTQGRDVARHVFQNYLRPIENE
jgi:hypothetical protein